MCISLIVGTRPNFVKVAPLLRAFQQTKLNTRLIHTGQHYDQCMSDTFFEDLGIPDPDVNLGVGSGSHVIQIAEVMRRLEADFSKIRPNLVVVVGDVNSTLAAALVASKMNIPLAHVEAGLRSNDRAMPEEINRIVVDALSDWLFVSEPAGVENLRREGISDEKVHYVGNVMIDTLFAQLETARSRKVHEKYGVKQN